MTAGHWWGAGSDPGFGIALTFDVEEVLEDRRSKYQHIQVVRTEAFGNVLLIDGDLMLTERDEGGYHEMMAHVPLNLLPVARTVLIVGGGDGGVCGQVLRHPNVERVVVVDIDAEVVGVARQHFPRLAACYDSSRVELVSREAAGWAVRPTTPFAPMAFP